MINKLKEMWEDYYKRGLIGKESYDLIMNEKSKMVDETLESVKKQNKKSKKNYYWE